MSMCVRETLTELLNERRQRDRRRREEGDRERERLKVDHWVERKLDRYREKSTTAHFTS